MRILLFVLGVLLMAGFTTNAIGQEAHSADLTLTVTIGATPLDIQGTTDLTLDEGGAGLLPPGVPITAVPDGAGAWLTAGLGGTGTTSYPALGGAPAAFEITGQAGANVLVSFALPYILYPVNVGNGAVHVDYDGTSACWVNTNGVAFYFNPKVGTTVTMNADGSTPTPFNLGGIFTVDPGSEADDFVGVAIVTCAYAAN